MNIERNDAILMEILQENKTIVNFLESIFGFLSRRTDFYHEMKNNDANIGFPPGFKEKLVLQVMKQFEIKQKDLMQVVPPAVTEVEIVSEEAPTDPMIENEQNLEVDNSTSKIQSNKKLINEDCVTKHSNKINSSFQPNEFYNGAKFETYCWSQTIRDLEIHIILPDNISSKNLKVIINSDAIKILNKQSGQIILKGQLYSKCKSHDAVWSISEKKLQINLDKVKSVWWHKLLCHEESVELSKLDCTRSLDDIPQEDQAIIEKLQWDHHRKMLGLPSSEDIKNQEILRLAWEAKDSPFKGQHFDPSIVKFE